MKNPSYSSPIYIAIADEHEIFMKGLNSIIESFGGFVITQNADSGKKLIELFEYSEILPDICLFDIAMPDGYEALKEIKTKWPMMKVLILSMLNNELSVIRTIKIGANGFLLKGCDPTDLKNALKSIYATGSYYSELLPEDQYESSKNSVLLKLSYREMELLSLCCSDLNYKAIADKMSISIRTVEGYIKSLYEKLNVNNRIGLVLFALKIGIMPIEQATARK